MQQVSLERYEEMPGIGSLILTRRKGESVLIGDDLKITLINFNRKETKFLIEEINENLEFEPKNIFICSNDYNDYKIIKNYMKIRVAGTQGNQVRVNFILPKSIIILREEIKERYKKDEN